MAVNMEQAICSDSSVGPRRSSVGGPVTQAASMFAGGVVLLGGGTKAASCAILEMCNAGRSVRHRHS